MAWNGTDFLVVWQDSPLGRHVDIYGDPGERRRQRARPRGHPHLHRGRRPAAPAVAWNGTDFLVVWEDYRVGFTDIYGARVSGAGTVLDPAGIPISTAAERPVARRRWPGTARDFLVVWTDCRYDSEDAESATSTAPG